MIATLSIIVFSLIAYSTVFGNPALPDESGFDFISLEADELDARVGDWFGTMFLAIGTISLFAAALGIVDYVSRLVADVVRVGYTGGSARWTESRIYFTVVWVMVVFGSTILLAGFDQPLVLVTISTVLGGLIMFVYSCLLVITNRRYLPEELKLRGYRLAIIALRDRAPGRVLGDRGRQPVREPVLMRRLAARVLVGLIAWAAIVAVAYALGLAGLAVPARDARRLDEPASAAAPDRAQRAGAALHVIVVGGDRLDLHRRRRVVAPDDGDTLELDPPQ